MGMERRGLDHLIHCLVNEKWQEPGNKTKQLGQPGGLDDKSRMTGGCHVRIRGSVGVKSPRATRQCMLEFFNLPTRCSHPGWQ